MSDVVKKANLGVMQHEVTACTLGQVAGCGETSGASGFRWPVGISNRQRCVQEWSSDTLHYVEAYGGRRASKVWRGQRQLGK